MLRVGEVKTGCITDNLPANGIGSKAGRSLCVADVMAFFNQVIESAKIGLRKSTHLPRHHAEGAPYLGENSGPGKDDRWRA